MFKKKHYEVKVDIYYKNNIINSKVLSANKISELKGKKKDLIVEVKKSNMGEVIKFSPIRKVIIIGEGDVHRMVDKVTNYYYRGQ